MNKQIIATENAPKAIGPYVQAVKTGCMVYTSGQLGINPLTGKLGDGIEEQTYNSMKNVGFIISEAGSDYSKVIKTTIFLKDLADFPVVNGIYESYFDGSFPARSCVQIAKLPLDGLVEIECIAQI